MTLARKLLGDEDERAVSPVIGVILMVAITVILAAVIAAFVLDLGQSQSAQVNAGVNVDNESSQVTIQLTDSGNAEYVNVTTDDVDYTSSGEGECSGNEGDGYCHLENVGDTASYDGAGNESTIIAVSGNDENLLQNVD